MRGINRVFLFGHLGHDPKLRTTPNGSTLAELALATNHATRSGDEWSEVADWHHVEVWGRDAETAGRFLTRGSSVCIEGQLRHNSWVDAQTGQKKWRTFVLCERLHLVNGGQRRAVEGAPDTTVADDDPVLPGGPLAGRVEEEEIPF